MKFQILNKNMNIFKFLMSLVSFFTLFSCSSKCINKNIDKNQVEKIIQKAFSTSEKFNIKEIEEGISGSRIFIASSNEKKYIVRFLFSKAKNEWSNEIQCLNIASQEGYGPKIYFTDPTEGIIIMEYLENEDLSPTEYPTKYEALANLLKKIHFGPHFPKSVDIFEKIQKNIELARSRKNNIPLNKLETILNIIKAAISKHSLITPCHLDLGPTNIRYYNNEFKAIDLETAAQFESYYDVAGLAICYCPTTKDESHFLSFYLGRQPTPIEKAKLYLMKQIVLLYGIECIRLFPAMTELLFQNPTEISYEKLATEFSKCKNNSFDLEYGFKMAKLSVEHITNCLKTVIKNAESNDFKNAINLLNMTNK